MKKIENTDILKFVVLLTITAGLLTLGHQFNLQERFNLEKIRYMIENAGLWGFAIYAAFLFGQFVDSVSGHTAFYCQWCVMG